MRLNVDPFHLHSWKNIIRLRGRLEVADERALLTCMINRRPGCHADGTAGEEEGWKGGGCGRGFGVRLGVNKIVDESQRHI